MIDEPMKLRLLDWIANMKATALLHENEAIKWRRLATEAERALGVSKLVRPLQHASPLTFEQVADFLVRTGRPATGVFILDSLGRTGNNRALSWWASDGRLIVVKKDKHSTTYWLSEEEIAHASERVTTQDAQAKTRGESAGLRDTEEPA